MFAYAREDNYKNRSDKELYGGNFVKVEGIVGAVTFLDKVFMVPRASGAL